MVDPSNAEQAQAWNGGQGAFWAAHADRFDRAVARYQPRFMAAAAIHPGSTVLDIGCGAGETTRAAASSGASVVGIDLSADLVALARARSEGVPNVSFVHGDVQDHPFPAESFDGAISRMGVMFFGDPVRAFGAIGRALRPGSPITLLTWQEPARNEWVGAFGHALTGAPVPVPPPDRPGPYSLSDPSVVRAVLTGAGFDRIEVTGVSEPMLFGHDVDDAFEFVMALVGSMLEGREDAAAVARLRATLADHMTPDGVAFRSAGWIVSAHASR